MTQHWQRHRPGQWTRRAWCALVLATTWGGPGAQPVPAAAPVAASPELDLPRLRARLAAWLESTGLATTLELQKLRWGTRADDPSARWLMLELRFLNSGPDELAVAMDFGEMLQAYQAAHGRPLADTLYYRLVHETGLARHDARVQVAVSEDTYAVARDANTRALRFEAVGGRQTRVSAALPAPAQPPLTTRLTTTLPALTDTHLAQRVQTYLAGVFTRHNSAAGRAAPVLALKPLENDYAALDVAGVRKLVLTGRDDWERLQISVELRPDTQGGAARAVCYLDGGYAPGLGNQLPREADYTDMETSYRAELQRFGETLLRGLQAHLAAGPR